MKKPNEKCRHISVDAKGSTLVERRGTDLGLCQVCVLCGWVNSPKWDQLAGPTTMFNTGGKVHTGRRRSTTPCSAS